MKQEHPTDTEPPSICFTSTNTPFMSLTDAQQTFISTSSSSQSQKKTPHFPLSERSKAFIKQHYPDVSLNEWNDWKWQVRHRIRSVDKLESILQLTETERRSIALRTQNLPIAITPYYLSLLDPLIRNNRCAERIFQLKTNLFAHPVRIRIRCTKIMIWRFPGLCIVILIVFCF